MIAEPDDDRISDDWLDQIEASMNFGEPAEGRWMSTSTIRCLINKLRECRGRPTEWQPIETAPVRTLVLMWWRPRPDPRYPHPADHASDRSNNKYAECCVIGQVSWHDGMSDGERPRTWWNGQRQEEQDIWHVTHWMPLPDPPNHVPGI